MDNTTISKLVAWLETWRKDNGAYNGFVIHRGHQKRMSRIHDTAWTQAAMIRGHANLYEKSGRSLWFERMQLAADLQCSRLDSVTGKYKYAGHEDDRFCSLVHCSLANCALLRAMDFVDEQRQRAYLSAVKCNVDMYSEKLWVEEEGAHKFSEIDFWSLNEDRFVVNFNMIAAEALILLWERTGEAKYKERACRLGEWLLANSDRTRGFYTNFLKDRIPGDQDTASVWMAHGGLPYQFTATQREPDNCVLIYAGLSLRGICALYRLTSDERYRKVLQEVGDFLLAMRDPETHFFYHTTQNGKIVRRPQFIAGIGMMLVGLSEAKELLKADWDFHDTLEAVLKTQYPNGSFPSFFGKERRKNRIRKEQAVWEDAVASVSWNAQLFEYLTLMEAVDIPSNGGQNSPTRSFVYADTKHLVAIVSLYPINFFCLYLCVKKWSHSVISFLPYDFYVLSGFRQSVVKGLKHLVFWK